MNYDLIKSGFKNYNWSKQSDPYFNLSSYFLNYLSKLVVFLYSEQGFLPKVSEDLEKYYFAYFLSEIRQLSIQLNFKKILLRKDSSLAQKEVAMIYVLTML